MTSYHFSLAAGLLSAMLYSTYVTNAFFPTNKSPTRRTVLLQATEDATAPFGKDLLLTSARVQHLLQSDIFRSSLDDPAFFNQTVHDHSNHPVPENANHHEFWNNFFEKEGIHQHAALLHLMTSRPFQQSLDDCDDSLSMMEFLRHETARNHILTSVPFRKSLDSNSGSHSPRVIGSHLQTLFNEKEMPVMEFDVNLAMLRGKSSLEKLLERNVQQDISDVLE